MNKLITNDLDEPYPNKPSHFAMKHNTSISVLLLTAIAPTVPRR